MQKPEALLSNEKYFSRWPGMQNIIFLVSFVCSSFLIFLKTQQIIECFIIKVIGIKSTSLNEIVSHPVKELEGERIVWKTCV